MTNSERQPVASNNPLSVAVVTRFKGCEVRTLLSISLIGIARKLFSHKRCEHKHERSRALVNSACARRRSNGCPKRAGAWLRAPANNDAGRRDQRRAAVAGLRVPARSAQAK